MLKIAGELTDGTITAWTGPATISNHIVPSLFSAATAAGRPDPQVISAAIISVTNDPDGIRNLMAEKFAIAGHLPSYRAMLDREGVAGPADLAIVGDEGEVRRQLDEYRTAGATELVCYPIGTEEEQARTFQLLAALARENSRQLTTR
jgi:alkanesulfonate monooxygenase SsuD/methylene tetrahydromethanopterin reductase-like flavin-dependent oxidoreductase (luciferase family)